MSENLPVKKDDSLHQLVALSCDIKRALTESFGEITDDVGAALLKLEQKLPNKADGYKFVIDDLKSEGALWKKRAADFTAIARAFEKYAETMQQAILGACQQMGVDEILGHEYRWKLQRAKPTVIIDDEAKIPSGHKLIVQTTQIKKDGILEDLKQGLPVPGAHLEESLFVRCYPNTQRSLKNGKSKSDSSKGAESVANSGNDQGATGPDQDNDLQGRNK